MAEKENNSTKFTLNQERAVMHERGDILVSASAGSGKTHVMISRIIRLILEGKTTVDKILATTFTDAAASEMKQKLKKELIKTVAETKDDSLAKQIPLVGSADVCTIHTFCAKLIRTYFYSVGLAPDFKILTEEDEKEFISSAMKKTFNAYYKNKDENFLRLVNRTCKKSDKDLREEVLSAYRFCTEEVDFYKLLDRSVDNFNLENFKKILEDHKERFFTYLENKIDEMKNYLYLAESNHFPKLFDKLKRCIASYETYLANGSIFFNPTDTKSYTIGNSGERCELNKEISALLKGVFAELKANVLPYISEQDCLSECEDAKNHTQTFVQLVKDFNENYTLAKKEENYLDFSDLQRYAMDIINDENIRNEIKAKYDFIFVDEYQDVNALQEKIISSIGKDNVFMVGDDKQSIYAFRGSRSEFFTEKQARMKAENKDTERFNDNFRSAINVVNAVNKVFDFCMTEDFYGVNYKEDAKLKFGKLFPVGFDGRFEIHDVADKTVKKVVEEVGQKSNEVYDILKNLTEDDVSEERASVEEVIGIIETEVGVNGNGRTYYDLKDKKEKKVEYKDIAILTGKSGTELTALIKALIKKGVPIACADEEKLLEYPEIITLVNILSTIDCMAQDIPLASTLKSVYGGFTDEDLYAIVKFATLKGKVESFYQAYKIYLSEGEGDLAGRLKAFDERFSELRNLADFAPVSEIIQKIIDESNYCEWHFVTPFGEDKVKRINAFTDYVISVGGELSVREFIKKFTANEGKIKMPSSANENAVHIMTMHKSKGLEFPVVINFNLSGNFSKKSLEGHFIHDRKYGLVPYVYEDKSKVFRDGFLRRFVSNKMKKDALKEQMRLLYVAMTRATYSLHLVYKSPKKVKDDINSFLGFLPSDLIALTTDEKTTEKEELLESGEKVVKTEQETVLGATDESEIAKIKRNLEFEYPFILDTKLPLKSSISAAMKGIEEDDVPVHYEFSEEEGQSVKDGVTAHKILELYDFDSKVEFKAQVENLISLGVLERESVEKLQLDKIKAVINSGAFDCVKGKRLFREKTFLASVPAKMLFGGEIESKVLAQGVIDLLAIGENEAIVIDYKYSAKSPSALKETYGRQLKLYAYAVESALKIKVTGKKIVSLLTGTVTEIN